jgi:N-acetylmuramoyl-L-alanine amidase
MVPGSNPSKLQYFASWADGAKEFRARLANANPPYDPQDISIKDYLLTYVGGPLCRQTQGNICANGETGATIAAYTNALLADLNRLLGASPSPTPPPPGPGPAPAPNTKAWAVAGSDQKLILPDDIVFTQRILPAGQTNQRPGNPMTPWFVTRHDTGNAAAGANAANQVQWLFNGAPGGDDAQGKVGFHFASDDHEIIQAVPINENAWHAGDGGNGPGNRSSIGNELCVNDGRNVAKAERNAAALDAGLLTLIGQPIAALRTHLSWVGPSGHHCPASLLPKWDAYVAQVQSFMTGKPASPSYPNPAGIPDDQFQLWFPWADPHGPITQWWLANRVAHGKMPILMRSDQPSGVYVFSDGTVLTYASKQVTEVTG